MTWARPGNVTGHFLIMAKKKEPTILEQALIEQARTLYYEFRTVAYISKQTGLKETMLKKLIYGPRGHMNPTTDSWFYERSYTNSEEFLELSARNRFLAHHFTAKALHETYEGMKAMDKRVIKRKVIGPDGKPQIIEERRYLTPQEMKYINDTVSTLDKLMRLSEGLPTDIIELNTGDSAPSPVTMPGGPANHIVLDMDRVARALKLDPAMNKLIQGAVNGTGQSSEPEASVVDIGESDQRSEQPGGVLQDARDLGDAQQPETDSGRVVAVVSEVIEPGPEVQAPGGSSRGQREGVEPSGRAQSSDGEGVVGHNDESGPQGTDDDIQRSGDHDEEREESSPSGDDLDRETGRDGAAVLGVEERSEGSDDWSTAESGGDPFADEYS